MSKFLVTLSASTGAGRESVTTLCGAEKGERAEKADIDKLELP